MGRRSGLNREKVVSVAAELTDERGAHGLTLAALADRLGVKTPSLYHHVRGLDGLERALRRRALHTLGDALRRAATGRSGPNALRAVGRAYRAYAHEHPGLYELVQRPAAPDDQEIGPASREVVEVVLEVLRGYGLEGEDAVHAARCLRSALHGFAALEATRGFGLPLDLDTSFERLLDILDRGMHPPP